MGFIYILENKINLKCYVGQTVGNANQRIKHHVFDTKRRSDPIGNAIKKYKLESFNQYVFECDDCDLDYFEIGFIRQMNTIAPNGYNLESGGNKNKRRHPDTIKKISDILKKNGNLKGKNNPFYGKKHPPEIIEKIKETKKNNPYIFTDEQKKKIGENTKRIHTGLKRSIETRKNISNARKGKCSGIENHNARKVLCVETGEIFNTMTGACKKYNTSPCKISQVCNKIKYRKTAGGYHWKYYEEI